MKKSILLIICMLVALCGCGEKGPTDYKQKIVYEGKPKDTLKTEVASNGDSYTISKTSRYSMDLPGKYIIDENIDSDYYYYSKKTMHPWKPFEHRYLKKEYKKYEVILSDFKSHKKVKTINVKKIFDKYNKDDKYQLMNWFYTNKICYKDGKYYLVTSVQKVPTQEQMEMNQKEAYEDVHKEYNVYDFYIDLETEKGTLDTKPSSNMGMGLTYEESLGYLAITDIFYNNVPGVLPDIGINPYLKDSPKEDKIIIRFQLNDLEKVDKSAKIFKIFPSLLEAVGQNSKDEETISIYVERMKDTELVGLFTPEGKQVEQDNLETADYCKEIGTKIKSREEISTCLSDKNTFGWYDNSDCTVY